MKIIKSGNPVELWELEWKYKLLSLPRMENFWTIDKKKNDASKLNKG